MDTSKRIVASAYDIVYRQALAVLNSRLLDGGSEEVTIYERNDDNGPWSDETDYYTRGLTPVSLPAQVYKIEGHSSEILNLQRDLPAFEAVRVGRLECEANGDAAGTLGSDRLALPEDVIKILDQLPQSDFCRRIFLFNCPNWQDAFTSQFRECEFVSVAAQLFNGDLVFFRAKNDYHFRISKTHEWSHFLQKPTAAFDSPSRHPKEYSLFCDAVDIEWRSWMPGEPDDANYALVCMNEHWAVIGQQVLHHMGGVAVEVICRAPLRTYFWLLALEAELLALHRSERLVCFPQLVDRILLSKSVVREKSRRLLADIKMGKGKVYLAHKRRGTVPVLLEMVARVEAHLDSADLPRRGMFQIGPGTASDYVNGMPTQLCCGGNCDTCQAKSA